MFCLKLGQIYREPSKRRILLTQIILRLQICFQLANTVTNTRTFSYVLSYLIESSSIFYLSPAFYIYKPYSYYQNLQTKLLLLSYYLQLTSSTKYNRYYCYISIRQHIIYTSISRQCRLDVNQINIVHLLLKDIAVLATIISREAC